MPPPANPSQYRHQAIRLYKELHRLGRDYPDAGYGFNGRIRRWFERNRSLTEEEDIKRALAMGEYIRDETMALYSLKKFRHLRRAYHAGDPPR
ncbi:hypothetical protein CALVIDRAFT_560331 [Calocera viscosa TUFC12733]|uniref:Complex 1 LYR protein domain-containing protein n=1 Tax=Calocera viscosa (strain TUFC12733) TaxID=1330018 RepID=A0A167QX88_CALVF|nr:hypothetical protein CALVIDRAFT_560331 [Calocera viscosa TUFC12733]